MGSLWTCPDGGTSAGSVLRKWVDLCEHVDAPDTYVLFANSLWDGLNKSNSGSLVTMLKSFIYDPHLAK